MLRRYPLKKSDFFVTHEKTIEKVHRKNKMKKDYQSAQSKQFFLLKKSLENFRAWFKKGVPPPATQVKSLYLMVFLILFGFATGTVFVLAYFKIMFYTWFVSIYPLAFVSAITLIPGIYAAWVSYHCWRGVRGYDWYMIPNYD